MGVVLTNQLLTPQSSDESTVDGSQEGEITPVAGMDGVTVEEEAEICDGVASVALSSIAFFGCHTY